MKGHYTDRAGDPWKSIGKWTSTGDGTAKGGVAIGISDQLQIPVKYIGVGEGIDDLRVFDKEAFVNSLFEN